MKKTTFILVVIIMGGLLPAKTSIPVQNATAKDWHRDSYWFFPWGDSGVHKGIDIFAKKSTPALASASGIVIFKGNLKRGGNVVAVLGAKWRIHYYAHLKQHDVHAFEWVSSGDKIGEVGDTGNAKGKPPHLHYSILTLIPNPVEVTLEHQGWKRMFYMNPAFAFTKQSD